MSHIVLSLCIYLFFFYHSLASKWYCWCDIFVNAHITHITFVVYDDSSAVHKAATDFVPKYINIRMVVLWFKAAKSKRIYSSTSPSIPHTVCSPEPKKRYHRRILTLSHFVRETKILFFVWYISFWLSFRIHRFSFRFLFSIWTMSCAQ